MKINFEKSFNLDSDNKGVLIVSAYDENVLSTGAQAVDVQTQGMIRRAIESSSFKGKKDEILSVMCPHNISFSQLIVIGLGKKEDLSLKGLEENGAKAMSVLMKSALSSVTFDISDDKICPIGVAYFASGMDLRSWKFDKYKTVDVNSSKGPSSITAITPDVALSEATFARRFAVNEGNRLTRHVVSEPPNVLYPKSMAAQAKELEALGVKVEILGEEEMKKLGMNALLGVGQGSQFESQLIVMNWNGGDSNQTPLAIVGKGVTFDSGGISIKPSANMEDMKYDMGGSGVVLGLMKALALRKAKANVVGVMGMVENMPSGTAQRPADVVKSMSGQTIEVINTDAEGRLVLADALWYTQDRFKPSEMINLATLTGAITVALGYEYAGLFSNNDQLAERLFSVGGDVGEPVWRFPMGKQYDRDIDSDIADVKNVGSGRGAGSITAAQFLQRFVNNVPWAHLDIAGMAWDKKDKPLTGKGATGFGVRLLDAFIEKHYEN